MASATSGFRVDIQILRAVAVVLVLLYHFWPNIVRSGFIGVDVFFAISGFLITRHLMTDAATAGKFSVGRFWARRARRLLPAAFLVTFVTSLAVFAFQSQALWTEFIRQAVASTFYVENWVLAGDSVDYLASENAPTAVQQYWSLSVEEQFYLVWPILIIFALWLARKRTQQFEQYALVLLTLVSVASLVYSILRVNDADASAYFSTLTRAWEFGFGGVVAIIGSRIGSLATALRRATKIAGWALLASAVILITSQSPFPGSLALLPIVGTCLIILGGQGTAQLETAAPKWLSPALFAGAISYSLYLWHWPIIVLFPFVAGMAPNFAMKVALLALCVILAWLTTRFVERPIQAQKWLVSGPLSKTLIIGLLAAGITVLPSGVAAAQLSVRLAADAQTRSEVLKNPCFGAASGVSGATGVNGAVCADVQWPLLTPDPVLAQSDVPTEAN
jgi:peptidoglycan/LPS O-acetylase OafA/YrhL